MLKTIDISGIKYTYDDELCLVVISTTIIDTDVKRCYLRDGLEMKFIDYVGTMPDCKFVMKLYAANICHFAIFRQRDLYTDSNKKMDVYDGAKLVCKQNAMSFRHNHHFGTVRRIEDEIAVMLEFGCAKQLLEVLLTWYTVIEKCNGGKISVGFHGPLLSNKKEYDKEELDLCLQWGIYPIVIAEIGEQLLKYNPN